jgi:hypothetical protein
MSTTIDQLKTISNKFAELARRNLTEDGELMPIVVTVKDGETVSIIGLADIPHGIGKQVTFRTLARFIAEKAPDAAIVVNDAYMKSLSRDTAKAYMDNFKAGQLETDFEARESIVIAFKGPGIPAHVCCFPYERNAVGDIVFTEAPIDNDDGWHSDAELNLLPDWWER